MKKAIWITAAVLGGIVILIIAIGVIAGSTKTSTATTGRTAPAASPSVYDPLPTPPVTDPKGTYSGSCNYTLGSDPVGGTARATGDITIRNTGNVGIVEYLKITWPQQGYAPLAMTRTVKLATGGSQDVPFHRPLSQTELDNLQNWQTGHNYADGCTYKVTITSTFGVVS